MKKGAAYFLIFILMICVCSGAMSACSGEALYSEGEGGLKVLCTVFAPFDFAREVGGDSITVTLLQDNGADLHNYTPTADTLSALSDADVFIYIGGVSDEGWVEKAIKASGNTDIISVCLMDCVEQIHAELENDWSDHAHGENGEDADGLGDSDHDDHDDDRDDDGDDDGDDNHDDDGDGDGHDHSHDGHNHEGDEHIWTSLENAKRMVAAIADAFVSADAANADKYRENRDVYTGKLDALDSEFRASLPREPHTAVVCDRFPFVYLFHDYHIPYIAAFSGCSTEVNSSFETQISLIKAVREHGLKAIFVIEGNDKSMAEAVASETGCEILTLDSLQSISRRDIESGANYLDIMRENLEVLRKAVG